MSSSKSSHDVPIKFYGFCSYPNCRKKKITENAPFVWWNGVHFSTKQVEEELSPIAKLAAISTPDEYVEKFGRYGFNMELHTECAAEWGMHLIQDALKVDYNLGSKLRNLQNDTSK